MPPGVDSRCRAGELHQGLNAPRVNFAEWMRGAFCLKSGKAPTLGRGGAADSRFAPPLSVHCVRYEVQASAIQVH